MAIPAIDFEALRRLSVSERLRLVEDLWDSIAEDAPDEALPVSPELAAELDRRLAEHEANPDDVVPWEAARARLLGE
jgi:putative addiction module component (TIGR02574 family)